jgi:hypothetical protein
MQRVYYSVFNIKAKFGLLYSCLYASQHPKQDAGSLSLSLLHTHTLIHSLTLSLFHSLTHSLSFFTSASHSHYLSDYHLLTLSLSLSHTHINSHLHTHIHTNTFLSYPPSAYKTGNHFSRPHRTRFFRVSIRIFLYTPEKIKD